MGYWRDSRGIQNFEPDSDEKTLYIEVGHGSMAMDEILAKANDHFGMVHGCFLQFEDIEIGAENIHTNCIGYDLYDSGDYTMYLVITLKDS